MGLPSAVQVHAQPSGAHWVSTVVSHRQRHAAQRGRHPTDARTGAAAAAGHYSRHEPRPRQVQLQPSVPSLSAASTVHIVGNKTRVVMPRSIINADLLAATSNRVPAAEAVVRCTLAALKPPPLYGTPTCFDAARRVQHARRSVLRPASPRTLRMAVRAILLGAYDIMRCIALTGAPPGSGLDQVATATRSGSGRAVPWAVSNACDLFVANMAFLTDVPGRPDQFM